jgi:hypothetical protein
MSLYIETTIHGSLDDLLQKTQNATLHHQWYAGMKVRHSPTTERKGHRRHTTELKIGADTPLSLIKEGAGYWHYEPTPDGVHLMTRYDYQTRFGWLGEKVDKLFLRPLLAWTTAWNFDRLRLWVERGQSPLRSALYWVGLVVMWLALAGAWVVWATLPTLQGLVPLLVLSLIMLLVHFAVEPYLPSASRVKKEWS